MAAQAALTPLERVAAGDPASLHPIDRCVLADLDRLGIAPAPTCSDAVFLRRAFLDVIGTLPTAQEARGFLADLGADKRSRLIDRLLERPEFADYWAMKWSETLRVKSEFPINLWPNAVQAYHRWIREAVRDHLPYDRFARELLTSSGSNFRVGPVNFYRALQDREPEAIGQAVALTFLGTRSERWTPQRRAGFAAFFSRIAYKPTSEWKEEIVVFDPNPVVTNRTTARLLEVATFPDGTQVTLRSDLDPRQVLADWLIRPENPWFARCAVNRVWCWLLGRGIIHEPDDIRADNPPANANLLRWLESDFIASGYDFKSLCRVILNSQTYQRASIPPSADLPAVAHFAAYPLRRLEAEVLIDALCQITGTTESYSSQVPEPFTFMPEGQRAVALADGSITSSFLELFGRPPRDTGLASERNNRPTAAQALHLLNSSHVQRKLEQGPGLRHLLQPARQSRENVTALYLTILSRFPTETERAAVAEYARSGGANGREAAVDLAWALVNSPEFLYRH